MRLNRAYPSQDHPRGCGEHLLKDGEHSYQQGSSPRMRGARLLADNRIDVERIIPADAGSTSSADSPNRSFKDHPRGCGEHDMSREWFGDDRGSSPRMRGAHCVRRWIQRYARIIPADAGSTPSRSPRAWPSAAAWTRIIPADAGSTQDLTDILARLEDHPRGCGEHSTPRSRTANRTGSSPRMRGARLGVVAALVARRIIPADAGSTGMTLHFHVAHEDHPRGCGEHDTRHSSRPSPIGSSPRMRGARHRSVSKPLHAGIIPADAGSTSLERPNSSRSQDHPRGCGEHTT